MMVSIPVVVLAGGIGERIKVLTGGKSKALLSLLGRYLVEYVLENIVSIGGTRVFMVVNNTRDFEDIAVKYGKHLELELIQQKKFGIEGAIASVKEVINSDFMLFYGDVVAPLDMYKELRDIYALGSYGVILVPEEEIEACTVARLSTSTSIDYFASGSSVSNEVGLYVVGGAFALPADFIELVESYGDMIKALNDMNIRYRLRPCIWSGWWVGVEYPWDLLRASLYLLHRLDRSLISSSARVSHKAVIEGPAIIEDDVEVDHFAVIKGPVYIGKGSYIGDHSLIRNYVSLEGENIVGSYTEIVWSSVQRRASIGGRSYIGFSVIGENSVVEPGVITLNVVPEKMKIARAIKIERKGREYTKLGAVVGSNVRVSAYTILKPSEIVEGKVKHSEI